MSGFAQSLISWQKAHGRHDLPWQGGRDPYTVWLSEIMLQQTQVSSVIPYYQRFLASFPDIAVLAAASQDEVLAHWSGLGYYSRARNLHRAAQLVVDDVILPIGEIAAKQTKKLTVTRDSGSRLTDFVTRQGQSFMNVVNRRQRAFGESTSGQISDLPNASMAASFITQVTGGQNYGHMGFVVTPGLDLSRVVGQGNAVLLAWMPDHSPVKPMNQFKANRGFRHTLWRVPVNLNVRN